MWLPWPPIPTSPMARGECAALMAGELGGDLADGLVPPDALEAAVGPAAERMLDALPVAHVVPDADALLQM
jgi:hypothetical protein